VCEPSRAAEALFAELTRAHPGRRTSSDGTCPGRPHHAYNPSSDHEGDPRLGLTSCAADVSHDPAHGVDVYELLDELKNDPRVKYAIRPNFETHVDEIWDNELGDTHWRDAHQRPRNRHEVSGPHGHLSFHHQRAVLDDTSPWLAPDHQTTEPEGLDMNADEVKLIVHAALNEAAEDPDSPLAKMVRDQVGDAIGNAFNREVPLGRAVLGAIGDRVKLVLGR
jgi:hypothetical protein